MNEEFLASGRSPGLTGGRSLTTMSALQPTALARGGYAERSRPMNDGDILLLENTRFHAAEEKNDSPIFAKGASLQWPIFTVERRLFRGPIRAHASTEEQPNTICQPKCFGGPMQAELDALDKGLGNSTHSRSSPSSAAPRVVRPRLDLLMNLVEGGGRCVVIGGGQMGPHLLAARRHRCRQRSLCEHDLGRHRTSRFMVEAASAAVPSCSRWMPWVGAELRGRLPPVRFVAIDAVPARRMILDVGPKSVEVICQWHRPRPGHWSWRNGSGSVLFEIGALRPRPPSQPPRHCPRTCTSDGRLWVSIAGGGDTVGGAQPCRRCRRFHLRLDGRRRLPGVEWKARNCPA